MEKMLKEKMSKVIDDLDEILQYVQINGLTNEQFVLDFLDEVNKMSVAF